MIYNVSIMKKGITKKLHHFRSELFFFKAEYLYETGSRDGKIVPFDDSFYEQMSHTFTDGGIPVSMDIKYLRPSTPPGKCYDRSLNMFLCFDDALLVRGDLKALKLKYASKGDAGHGWIEIGNNVYDPTYLMRFDKDLYYKIFGVSHVTKYSKEDYCQNQANKKYYDQIKNTTLADFQPNGRKRPFLLMAIPLLKGIADNAKDPAFQKELDAYLTAINYDEQEIYHSMRKKGGYAMQALRIAEELDKQR